MNTKTRTPKHSRSGVTLLFTISMIVLFLLMGTTFVVVANDYFKTARRRIRLNTFRVDATALLDKAAYDVLRGVSLDNASSPLRTHSILEDQYGYGHTTNVASARTGAAPGLTVLSVDLNTQVLTEIRDNTATFDFAAEYADGVFGGRVLSVVSGPARGYSGRIVSDFLNGTELLLVVPTDDSGINLNAISNDRIVINGRDFVGQGAGDITGMSNFDDVNGIVPLTGEGIRTPNRLGFSRAELIFGQLLPDGSPDPSGLRAYIPENFSPNEPYDIPDENNLFLASSTENIPSFHRDRHYAAGLANVGTSAAAIRSFSFRPLHINADFGSSAQLHPNSGSESFFGNYDPNNGTSRNGVNAIAGLDVDTDGDGENDAVWIDIGLPMQTDNLGRQFRPLVAYRILDMDGRLNLNTHGSYADSTLGVGARRGSSFGVAEVSLRSVFGGGNYDALLNSRADGDSTVGNPANSLQAAQTLFGYVDANFNTGGLPGSGFFASGADIFGKNVVGRDTTYYGNDSLSSFTQIANLTGASTVVPYAADLGLEGGVGDDLFRAHELEALLRKDDVDSELFNSRLSGLGTLANNFEAITTDSAEVSMPPAPVVSLLWDATGNDRNIYRQSIARRFLSEEVLMGGLFDLNQLTGNGFDEDGDRTFDEPSELLTNQQTPQFGTPLLDLNNDGNGRLGDDLARQQKANQLYILALLATGDTRPAFATEFDNDIEYRTAVAQWAVNIVDFSDSDSIMTAFEFDINPFNGSFVDGDPRTDDSPDARVVFGAERPELLITETLVTHDRRNQDLPSDNGDNDDVAGNDEDWDSGWVPESSVFIELYNPWTQLDAANAERLGLTPAQALANAVQVPPAELYDRESRGGDNFYGVDLSRTTPVGNDPVWRIGVKRDIADTAFLRAIFFTEVNNGTPSEAILSGTRDNFYPSNNNLQVVEPGGHFIIGSAGNAGRGVTTFGRLNVGAGVDVPNTRRIQLDDSNNEISYFDPGNPFAFPAMSNTRQCGIAIIDRSYNQLFTSDPNNTRDLSLSLSTPDGGYEDRIATAAVVASAEVDGTLLTPAIDVPLDAIPGNGRNDEDIFAIWNNGINDDFRHIYLQRLADPTLPFDVRSNPYITIDRAAVDLIAFNGLNNDPNNNDTIESRTEAGGVVRNTTTTDTALVSAERGENRANLDDTRDIPQSRRTFFRTADIEQADTFVNRDVRSPTAANHNFDFGFYDQTNNEELVSLGRRNESIGGLNASGAPLDALGELVWLNRPYANRMELVHVPLLPNGGADAEVAGTLLDQFNRCRVIDEIPALINDTDTTTPDSTPQEIFSYYFSDDKFGHLMGFGGMSPADAGAGENLGVVRANSQPSRRAPTRANRFDIFLDFVDVPSKFQGLRKWLQADFQSDFLAGRAVTDGMTFNMHAPYNSLPTFRTPGKININSVNQDTVFTGMAGGFTARVASLPALEGQRDIDGTWTDYGGRFMPGTVGQFVQENERSNAEAGLFRRNPANRNERIFDSVSTAPTNNANASSWYENEFRQRLDAVTTTRSSVFSIWVTIGYFEVDQYGLLGAELGSDEGQVRRNRAFYMVDRSIPVACEPGKNHNVDNAILVRTIIE